MKVLTATFSLGFAMLIILLMGGCASPVPSGGDGTGVDEVDDAGFEFADDADPALAGLPYVQTELLVQRVPGADEDELQSLYEAAGVETIDEIDDLDMAVVQVSADRFHEAAAILADSELVEDVHKNYLFSTDKTPNDPQYGQQSHLTQINAPNAWDMTTGSSDVILAVVDSGVDGGHPDLAGKITDGWNLVSGNDDFSDVYGHGTEVAGVAAAASNNNAGVAGLAWDCPLLAVRVSQDDGRAAASHLAAGILWSVEHGAKVINVSFAPLWSNKTVQLAAEQAHNRGSLVIISAGNSGTTQTSAGYAQAVFIGAVDGVNQITYFSDRGPFVDLSAPGVGIRTTVLGDTYNISSGTSFAAPIVAGVAGLVWSINPDLKPIQVEELLRSSATDGGAAGKDNLYGYGIIDALGAVEGATETTADVDTVAPTATLTLPKSGANLSGQAKVSVSASDNEGVASVSLAIDSVAYATDKTAPYQFTIKTSKYAKGNHVLSITATDTSGNTTTPKPVTVKFGSSTVSPAGIGTGITFTSPPEGSTVTSDTQLTADLHDLDGLASLEWKVDGLSMLNSSLSGTSSSVSYLWRATTAAAGPHTISLTVIDGQGQSSSATLNLTRG